MTSIPEISARGSLILRAKFQIPVGPRSGREGEKCRPLDHMRQIPFIHQAPFVSFIKFNVYIYIRDFPHISFMWYLHCVLKHCTVVIYACALSELLISSFSATLKSFCMNTGTNWYEIQRDTAINSRHRCIQYGVGQSMRVFCEFTRGNGVKHKLIAPHHPRSNCQAERFVQTFMAF